MFNAKFLIALSFSVLTLVGCGTQTQKNESNVKSVGSVCKYSESASSVNNRISFTLSFNEAIEQATLVYTIKPAGGGAAKSGQVYLGLAYVESGSQMLSIFTGEGNGLNVNVRASVSRNGVAAARIEIDSGNWNPAYFVVCN